MSFIRSIRNPAIRRHLSRDIRDGLKIGVTGTPSYVIDGNLYVSNIPASVLSQGTELILPLHDRLIKALIIHFIFDSVSNYATNKKGF